MSIEIVSARLDEIRFTKNTDGAIKTSGKYSLINSKGDVIAKQDFNEYSSNMQIAFNEETVRDTLDTFEQAVEIKLGIQEALKTLKT